MKLEQGTSVAGMTSKQVDDLVADAGGYFTREHYPFGRAWTYIFPESNETGMVYEGKLYLSPKGTLHPSVVADLQENWWPSSLDDEIWKQRELRANPTNPARPTIPA